MLGDKELHFADKGTDLAALRAHIEKYLNADGFTVQTSTPSEQGIVIQAKKSGILREIVAADRALTVAVTGSPADFTVRFGIGKWIEHLAVAAIETLLISELFLVIDVADAAWNLEIENKLIASVKAFVG